MKEQGASQEETAFLEEGAGCQWEEEGMEVSAETDTDEVFKLYRVQLLQQTEVLFEQNNN